MSPDDYLTTAEVAALYRCSQRYVRDLAYRGLLPAVLTPGEGRVRMLFEKAAVTAALQPVNAARAEAMARHADDPPWGEK